MLSSMSGNLTLRGVLSILVGLVAAFVGDEFAGLVSIALGIVMSTTPDVGAMRLALLFGFVSLTYRIPQVVAGLELRRTGNTVKSVLTAAA